MSSSIDEEEKKKVRAARASFFGAQKRKVSATTNRELDDNTTSTTIDTRNIMSSKRFKFPKMGSSKNTDTDSEIPLIVAFYDREIQGKDARHRSLEEILDWPDEELERCHNYIQMLFPVPEGSMFNWEAPVINRKVMDAFRSRPELQDQLEKAFERMLRFYGFAVESKMEHDGNEPVGDKHEESEGAVEGQEEARVEDKDQVEGGAEQSQEAAQDKATKAASDATDTSTPKQDPSLEPREYAIVRGPNWSRNSRNWAIRFDHNHLRITRILRCLRVLGLQKQCDAFYAALQDVFDDPDIRINERSMTYWRRAAVRSLYIAPDDDRIEWLREWETEQRSDKVDE